MDDCKVTELEFELRIPVVAKKKWSIMKNRTYSREKKLILIEYTVRLLVSVRIS